MTIVLSSKVVRLISGYATGRVIDSNFIWSYLYMNHETISLSLFLKLDNKEEIAKRVSRYTSFDCFPLLSSSCSYFLHELLVNENS